MAQIDVSDTFARGYGEIKGDKIVKAAVDRALIYFQERDWKTLPELYSAYDGDYTYRCHPNYLITFALKIDRGNTSVQLKTIQWG